MLRFVERPRNKVCEAIHLTGRRSARLDKCSLRCTLRVPLSIDPGKLRQCRPAGDRQAVGVDSDDHPRRAALEPWPDASEGPVPRTGKRA